MIMAPFTREDAQGNKRMNMTRIVEALMIAGIIGAINVIGTTQVFETKFEYMKEQIQEIKTSINDIRRDVYKPYGNHAP